MTYIDPNMTFSPQMCDLAVGGFLGVGATVVVLGKLILYCLGFYAIYKLADVLKTVFGNKKWRKK